MASYEKNVAPYLDDIKEWTCSMTKEQIAKRLGIGRRTLYRYAKDHEELRAALEEGRVMLIQELKSTLIKKAKGFHYKETKKVVRSVDGVKTQVVEEYEKYAQPDTGAIHLLLKNMDPEWRNDDKATLDLKREQVQLQRDKFEETSWTTSEDPTNAEDGDNNDV